ncbi:MAG: leucine-rich repeat domain-containing protein, partial [Alteromonadaceae bacterium]|nr:leucine-rich repeat domain-containing protein [Alteromonadaceae bacterium]
MNNVVNTSVLGTYIITYTATDNAGNTSSVTRTVNVVLYLAISEVPFIDENFKICVLAAKEENGWELISEVDELSCTESITNFSGLENLTSLTVLYLDTNNQISDISALANLTSLTTLYLASNPISDISALANLTSLTTLYLINN